MRDSVARSKGLALLDLSPFELIYGYHPQEQSEIAVALPNNSSDDSVRLRFHITYTLPFRSRFTHNPCTCMHTQSHP